ncbi:MAG: GNAT family N-acetyltransferase [Chitinophagaceae bacterium]
MIIEELSTHNLGYFTNLVLELWPDCEFEEEYDYYKSLIQSEKEVCYLIRKDEIFIAFIHLALRSEYVEGADDLPVAYIEGIYVQPNYQKNGIAMQLVARAEDWAKQKGAKQIASDTSLTNIPAIAFHKKAGFTEAERIVCFIKDL